MTHLKPGSPESEAALRAAEAYIDDLPRQLAADTANHIEAPRLGDIVHAYPGNGRKGPLPALVVASKNWQLGLMAHPLGDALDVLAPTLRMWSRTDAPETALQAPHQGSIHFPEDTSWAWPPLRSRFAEATHGLDARSMVGQVVMWTGAEGEDYPALVLGVSDVFNTAHRPLDLLVFIDTDKEHPTRVEIGTTGWRWPASRAAGTWCAGQWVWYRHPEGFDLAAMILRSLRVDSRGDLWTIPDAADQSAHRAACRAALRVFYPDGACDTHIDAAPYTTDALEAGSWRYPEGTPAARAMAARR